MTITIEKLERRARPGMMPSLVLAPGVQDGTPAVEGWYADVVASFGRLECSRLDGEEGWVIDALWHTNGAPVFANGFGARYLMLKAPAGEIVELLDQELASR